MIANLINTVVALVLVWAAILDPHLLKPVWVLVVGAVVIFALAMWALLGDHHPWQNTTNCILAVLLLVVGLLPLAVATSALIQFWTVFWIGVAVAILALWAALYRPSRRTGPDLTGQRPGPEPGAADDPSVPPAVRAG